MAGKWDIIEWRFGDGTRPVRPVGVQSSPCLTIKGHQIEQLVITGCIGDDERTVSITFAVGTESEKMIQNPNSTCIALMNTRIPHIEAMRSLATLTSRIWS